MPTTAPLPTALPTDPDAAHDRRVEWLLGLPETAFDDAVVRYVMNRDRTTDDEDVYRDERVVERTYEAVKRVLARLAETVKEREAAAADLDDARAMTRGLRAMRRRLEHEAGALRPLAGEAREMALRVERRGSPRQRARDRLLDEVLSGNPDLQRRLVALIKDERRKDDR